MRHNETAVNATTLSSAAMFSPPDYAIKLNKSWSLSLLLSIFSAFMATLVQHWVRRYLNAMHGPGSARDRALLHASLLGGIQQFAMKYSADVVVLSLHGAVALFIYGLVVYLEALNEEVAWTVKAFAIVFLAVYVNLTVLPIACPTSPYATPLTDILRFPLAVSTILLQSIFFAGSCFHCAITGNCYSSARVCYPHF